MVATLSAPLFSPAPALYSGAGDGAPLVPWVYDVAINGRPYMVDRKSDQFQRGWEARIRDSVDMGSLPGEATINPQGMWRRSQASWHLGAGQEWADGFEAQPGRFWRSVGVDVWTRNQLSLLPSTTQLVASSASTMHLISDGVRLYVSHGQTTVFYTSNLSGAGTAVTGTPAADVTSVATNGYTTWLACGTAGVYRVNRGGTAATQAINGTVTTVGFARNRLLGAQGASLYDLTAVAYGTNGALPTALFTHANTDFVWVGFCAGPAHIFAAGFSGQRSIIYRITITAEGASLTAPTAALELPIGEKVQSISEFPGGFVLIGTNKGVRLAVANSEGALTVGAVIPVGSVSAAVAEDRFMWFGWAGHTSGSAGVGRVDVSQLTAALTPAYASDVFAQDVSGAVLSVARHNGRTLFAVATSGVWLEAATPVADGWLDTGRWTWNVPDPKMLAKVDVRTFPLPATDTVTVVVYPDEDAVGSECFSGQPAGSVLLTFNPQQTQFTQTGVRVKLFAHLSESPVVTRVNLRAFVAPRRSRVIRVPILLHDRLEVENGDVHCDPQKELALLDDLVQSVRVVLYREGYESYQVVVEDVLWVPLHDRSFERRWNGTAVVTMRSVE
jgi:hypothetical protein